MTSIIKLILPLMVCLVEAVLLSGQANAYMPRTETQRLCRQRTGLTDRDIESRNIRNDGCAIDCITRQGTVMTVFSDDGNSCRDAEGYICVFGKCRLPEDKVTNEEIRDDLHLVDIGVKSAYVADRDPYPTQGESDAFVVVEMVSGGEPTFKKGEVVCYTHVIQDNSYPKWNFVCKPLPLSRSAKLRFVVLDSDKPDTNPQLLGSSVESLDSLMNVGSRSLTLNNADLSGGPYRLEVEITGKKYTPSN